MQEESLQLKRSQVQQDVLNDCSINRERKLKMLKRIASELLSGVRNLFIKGGQQLAVSSNIPLAIPIFYDRVFLRIPVFFRTIPLTEMNHFANRQFAK